jgi:1-phosphofructokinase family hexose kinase
MTSTVLVINANPLLNLVHIGVFTPGAVNRVAAMGAAAEGKGVNVARVLARHGHRVVLTGFAGGHAGRWLRDLIRDDGVEEALVETASELRMGFMATGGGANHPTTVFPSGFAVTRTEYQTLLDRVVELLGSTRLVIASGSVPDPAIEDLYVELLRLCANRDIPCWLDAYGPAMSRALAGEIAPALAKPNRQEWAMSSRWERVAELHVTDGPGAVEIRSASAGIWRVAPPVVKEVNPVGSGDCYIAGLAHGWLTGMDWAQRLRYAAAAGAANALRADVAMIAPKEIEGFADRVKAERG